MVLRSHSSAKFAVTGWTTAILLLSEVMVNHCRRSRRNLSGLVTPDLTESPAESAESDATFVGGHLGVASFFTAEIHWTPFDDFFPGMEL